MSHIDEALKRAQGGDAAPAPGDVGPGEADESPVPPADVFTDAWSVAGDEPAAGELSPVSEADGTAADPDDAAIPVPFGGFHPAHVERIVGTPVARPAFVEQYRRLAGTLHHAQLERSIKLVMVTSALAGEGKTLTATNLALTFSESYRRSVLLVDADLRRPTLHEIFQVPNVSGLGDCLRSHEERKLALIEISPRLTLLTAGRPDPDPMSGLTSGRMTQVLEEAAARFDWVIIDTPPVGLLPDANLLARTVDATLFVVKAGSTPYQAIQKAITTIGRDRIIGVVMNAADETVDTSYNYYRYYDSPGNKDRK